MTFETPPKSEFGEQKMRDISDMAKWVLVLFVVCILGWRPSSISATTDPGDASALKNMYSSLNSPPQLSQWSANGDDPCGQSWKGVTCSGQRVTEIDISDLGLSGSIGFQLSSLTFLTKFDVSNNNLAGSVPFSLPPNLTRLHLGSNNFNGGIPYSVSQMISLQYLNISHNQLQNQLDDFFSPLSSLSSLDLSFNALVGNIPESFRSLSSLSDLYLENNQLTGTIDVLANLPIENMNIENNHFTGWIPEQLKSINLKKDGNSWSSGPAPPPPPGTPPASRNNRNSGSGSDNTPSSSNGGGKKSGIGAGGVAGIVISIFVVGGIIAFFLIKRRKSRRSSLDIEKVENQPFAPFASNEVQERKSTPASLAIDTKTFDSPALINLRPPPIDDRVKSFDEDDFSKKPIVIKKKVTVPINVKSYSIADLQMATGSFSVENLLGEGSFGRVYRAQFDDGMVLAVKKVHSAVLPSQLTEDFTEIVSKISQLHHPNLTELVGYCSEHGQHLLVYEFHKNGSLHEFLHLPYEYYKPLIWNSRVKVALGTARALEYMHEVCSPSIIHKNIKSSNILLDAELNPHLSDCGLANFISHADQVLDHSAASGYSAPEVVMSGQYTLKSDVYSFGVVMLELLCGRKPFDSTVPRSEQSLVRWATPQLHDIDALEKMVDPALNGLYPVKSLSRFADVIALCVQPEPEFRPPMSEVVQALVRLVQRANMSKRTIGIDQAGSQQRDAGADIQDNIS